MPKRASRAWARLCASARSLFSQHLLVGPDPVLPGVFGTPLLERGQTARGRSRFGLTLAPVGLDEPFKTPWGLLGEIILKGAKGLRGFSHTGYWLAPALQRRGMLAPLVSLFTLIMTASAPIALLCAHSGIASVKAS
jgi:hypothetical protein